MMNPNNSIKENQAMRKRYGTWVAIMVATLMVAGGISSVRAQLLNPKYYPTLSLRNWHCNPDGIQRVPTPGSGGDRFFLVPIWIYNEVDTTYNPNRGGQHLEPIRSFEFKFVYLTQAMILDTLHGDPIVKVGPSNSDTALAKSFFIHFSDQPDLSTGNPYLHVIRISGASSTPLPLSITADSGCSENSGVLFWLRFRVVVSAVNAGQIFLDSTKFNDHAGDSLLNP